jgi:hypothetical protein
LAFATLIPLRVFAEAEADDEKANAKNGKVARRKRGAN